MRGILFVIAGMGMLAGCFLFEENEKQEQEDFKPEVSQPETGKVIHGVSAQEQGDQLVLQAVEVARVPVDTGPWEILNDWEDTDTPAAQEAGLAWAEESGLNWDQKFGAWVNSLTLISSQTGPGQTFLLTTPWGKTLPAPVLEGAELAMFLRIAFASWYQLPFFLEAHHSRSGVFWAGHFGIVNSNGAVSGTEDWFSTQDDHTTAFAHKTPQEIAADWPRDESLRALDLSNRNDDFQPAIEGQALLGAYLDEIFLNKRAGHFLGYVLTNFGSMHLLNARNTFNLKAESIREGDVLAERWTSSGIGHAMVIKTVTPLDDRGHLDAELIYGSMPRIQARFLDVNESKVWFTSDTTGGLGVNDEGEALAATGSGLRRWRIAKRHNDHWVQAVAGSDQEAYIASSDQKSIATRPGRLRDVLGLPTPEQQRNALLVQIQVARYNLSQKPASCANRTRREGDFSKLYEINAQHFGISRAQTDKEYRTLADYVFAELEYDQSRTCCWQGSTPSMYDIIMEYAEKQVANQSTCFAPSIFMSVEGGYDEFEEYADEIGRGAEWEPWSEDQSCPQRDTGTDTRAQFEGTAFCDWYPESDPVLPETCEDVDWTGQCEGNTVVWCEDEIPQYYECTAGMECAWLEEFEYYWCI